MHFDNYLQNKNFQPTNPSYNKFGYQAAENNNHNNSFRQTITQHNLNFNKAPSSYAQSRPESGRQTIQSNFNSSLLKKGNPQPKSINPGLPFNKPQVTATNNYISLAANGPKLAQQKKYICLSPAKQTSKVSSALEPPQAQQSKIQQRRSESVADPRLKDLPQNSYLPWSRQSTSALGMTKQTSHLTPFQLNFNNTQLFPEKSNSHIDRKESSQKTNFFKIAENQWVNSQNVRENNRVSPLQQPTSGKPYLFLQNRQSQPVMNKNIPFNDSFYKQPLNTLTNTDAVSNKESNKDEFQKQYATSKNLSFIEKDIQKLKYASKRVDQVYHNEISKNFYFNKFLQEKGIKTLQQEKIHQFKDTKSTRDPQKRIEALQKQAEEKQKEIAEKNKEISDKSKSIVDKNKVIDSLSIELRQSKCKLQARELQIIDKSKQLFQVKEKLQALIALRQKDEFIYQQVIEYNKNQEKNCHNLQILQKQNERLRLEIQKKIKQLEKATDQKSIIKEKLILQEAKIQQYKSQIQNTKESLRKKQQQLTMMDIKLQEERKKVIRQQNQLSNLKKYCKNVENISYQNLLSAQLLQKQEEAKRNQPQIEKLTNKIADHEAKLNQLSILLLNRDNYDHEPVISRIKQIKQTIKSTQVLRQKEHQRMQEINVQRLHQEYLQKKFNQLSREFKKVNSKFCIVTNQVQQGWRLLRQANHQIVLLNLQRLNQVYQGKEYQNQ